MQTLSFKIATSAAAICYSTIVVFAQQKYSISDTVKITKMESC